MIKVNTCFIYTLYGLTITSTRSLPGLTPIDTQDSTNLQSDVWVELLELTESEPDILADSFWQVSAVDIQQQGFYLWQSQQDDGLYWRLRSLNDEDLLDFVINPDGAQVWGFWSAAHLFQDAVSLLLGAVLGHLLRLRDVPCLHSSVVEIEGAAIALIGESGAGKSTTAAALAFQGYPMLTDDIAALHWCDDRGCDDQVWVQPGYPSLRLWSPSLEALQVSNTELSRVSSRFDKCFLNLSDAQVNADSTHPHFTTQSLPLKAIYVLAPRSNLGQSAIVESLPPMLALQQLLTHAYGRGVLTRAQSQTEFRQLAAIAQTLPIRLLHRPDDLQKLDDLCTVIAEDFADLQRPNNTPPTDILPTNKPMPIAV